MWKVCGMKHGERLLEKARPNLLRARGHGHWEHRTLSCGCDDVDMSYSILTVENGAEMKDRNNC